MEGFREGWFFSDSDAYKWLEAASLIWNSRNEYPEWDFGQLKCLMDDFISQLSRTQMDDGYLYTYNQVHFPNSRWENLMIEHELYCHGHLIEAGISHLEATGEKSAFNIAQRAADLLVREFLDSAPNRTSGHEEIEIALLRLFQITGRGHYLELAHQFLDRRGKVHPFGVFLMLQNDRVKKRDLYVKEQRRIYQAATSMPNSNRLPPGNSAKTSASTKIRWFLSALSGNYFQMHAPIHRQNVPVGHSVRFGYLETATAMLYQADGDPTNLLALTNSWEHMVDKRMYVTGGLGSLPDLEGFGNDYELDPEVAYAETCAAIASLYWNWEMTKITGEAKYSDLFEWQLYNAASVGMGVEGNSYLYNNPLACRGGITRRAWFAVPCCPSNLSRVWASLGKYIFSNDDENLWVHQYIGGHLTLQKGLYAVELESQLPWSGKVTIKISTEAPTKFTIHLRIPSWAGEVSVCINETPIMINIEHPIFKPVASGYDPRTAVYLPVERNWEQGDVIKLDFEMPVRFRHAHPRVRGHRNKVAITRGPLVYCLESVDNPEVDLFTSQVDLAEPVNLFFSADLLGGSEIITAITQKGQDLTFIPYFLWANRGESQMTVWVNT